LCLQFVPNEIDQAADAQLLRRVVHEDDERSPAHEDKRECRQHGDSGRRIAARANRPQREDRERERSAEERNRDLVASVV
jgi:hypothetical protein